MARGQAYEGTEREREARFRRSKITLCLVHSLLAPAGHVIWRDGRGMTKQRREVGGLSLCYVRGFMSVYARYQFYWSVIRVRVS